MKAVSAAVVELIADVRPAPRLASVALPDKVTRGKGHWIADLLERVIETETPGEVFGATSLIAEIQGFCWAAYGLLDVVRKGTSHREGLYTKPAE